MGVLRPSLSVDEDSIKDEDDGKHIWSTLLEEVTHKTAATLSSSKRLIVLGDDECGKTTLIARLQGNKDPKKGFGLEYTLLDIKDEARDDQTKLNVWILDGNPCHSHLLKFSINEESIGDCMVMITVNMAEPWNIVDGLEKWADVLKRHINHLKITEDKLLKHKMEVLHQFSNYLEPDLLDRSISSVSHRISESSISSNLKKTGVIHPATATLLSNNVLASNSEADDDKYDTDSLTPSLEKNILTCNLGIPIIVVVTKTDLMNSLEKNERFTDEHFDFIQMHIRRFCLLYGAALFYVSVKEDKNCDLLNRYIQSRFYGFPFTQAAYVVERDCIFVPTGWDNEKKIGIQVENLTHVKPQSPYLEVIPRPPPRKTAVNKEPEILAQDDQIFLTRLSATIQRETPQSNTPNNLSNIGTSDSLINQMITAVPGSVGIPGARPTSGITRNPNVVPRTKGDTGVISGTGNVNVGAPGSGTESVLASFFNSLLHKRPSTTASANSNLTSLVTTESTPEKNIDPPKESQPTSDSSKVQPESSGADTSNDQCLLSEPEKVTTDQTNDETKN